MEKEEGEVNRIDVQIWIKLTRPVMMIVFIRLFVVILLN